MEIDLIDLRQAQRYGHAVLFQPVTQPEPVAGQRVPLEQRRRRGLRFGLVLVGGWCVFVVAEAYACDTKDNECCYEECLAAHFRNPFLLAMGTLPQWFRSTPKARCMSAISLWG